MIPALVLVGLTSGLIGGLLGVGAGALIIPALIILARFDQHRAHGTTLFAIVALSLGGFITYAIKGNVGFHYLPGIMIGGACGAFVGAKLASRTHGTLLRRLFCVFLVLVGIRMIWGAFACGEGSDQIAQALSNAWLSLLIFLGIGAVGGFVGSLLGVGGGVLTVPLMVILLCLQQQLAQGISFAGMLATAIVGARVYHTSGQVDLRISAWLGLGAMIGAIAGAIVADGIEAGTLRIIFGCFVIVMSVFLALRKDREESSIGT